MDGCMDIGREICHLNHTICLLTNSTTSILPTGGRACPFEIVQTTMGLAMSMLGRLVSMPKYVWAEASDSTGHTLLTPNGHVSRQCIHDGIKRLSEMASQLLLNEILAGSKEARSLYDKQSSPNVKDRIWQHDDFTETRVVYCFLQHNSNSSEYNPQLLRKVASTVMNNPSLAWYKAAREGVSNPQVILN